MKGFGAMVPSCRVLEAYWKAPFGLKSFGIFLKVMKSDSKPLGKWVCKGFGLRSILGLQLVLNCPSKYRAFRNYYISNSKTLKSVSVSASVTIINSE